MLNDRDTARSFAIVKMFACLHRTRRQTLLHQQVSAADVDGVSKPAEEQGDEDYQVFLSTFHQAEVAAERNDLHLTNLLHKSGECF